MNDDNHASDSSGGQQEFQPGETISPRSTSPDPVPAPTPPSPAPSYQAAPPQPPAPSLPQEQHFFNASDNVTPPAQSPQPPVSYEPQQPQDVDLRMEDNSQGVSWTASEFIAHQKPPEWYMALGIAAVVVAAIIFFMSHDVFSVVIVIIVALIFGFAAGRPPRQIQYGVDDDGISIGRHFYPYKEFSSFSVADEGSLRSIVLLPLKRFMPTISMYFDPADEIRIGDILSEHLPMHQHREAATDKLMRRIRF